MRASSVRATAYVIVRSGHQAAQCNSLEIASSQGGCASRLSRVLRINAAKTSRSTRAPIQIGS